MFQDCKRARHTRSTEIEPYYLLPPGVALWPKYDGAKVDKATAMNVDDGDQEVTSVDQEEDNEYEEMMDEDEEDEEDEDVAMKSDNVQDEEGRNNGLG
jgi:hypothetical protein